MPRHNSYGKTSIVRWNKAEGYFEMLCPSCQKRGGLCYWPLTLNEHHQPEFWHPRSMQACRACILSEKRRVERERLRNDPEYREKRRLKAAAYYKENKKVMNMKHKYYMREYRNRETAA